MSTVEEIVNAIKELPPGERAEVKRRLETIPAQTDENGDVTGNELKAATDLDQRIHRALYEAGLVSQINPPKPRLSERPPPIKIKGKPLSETIIEERR
jgi:hypothetical protein